MLSLTFKEPLIVSKHYTKKTLCKIPCILLKKPAYVCVCMCVCHSARQEKWIKALLKNYLCNSYKHTKCTALPKWPKSSWFHQHAKGFLLLALMKKTVCCLLIMYATSTGYYCSWLKLKLTRIHSDYISSSSHNTAAYTPIIYIFIV